MLALLMGIGTVIAGVVGYKIGWRRATRKWLLGGHVDIGKALVIEATQVELSRQMNTIRGFFSWEHERRIALSRVEELTAKLQALTNADR